MILPLLLPMCLTACCDNINTPPEPLEIIGRKEKLKLLGVTFEQVPVNWDIHIDYLLSKASSRLYIIRICKYYGYSIENLDLHFQSLILSVFSSVNTALSDLLPPQRTRRIFYLMSGQVVLNPFLLIDVS
ncbi:unnamed protein product [Porites lobata]|uniref:Lipoprotein n=1 Tax=Porites lobata TaxID=104759 RepID=A0ABN8Q8N3_9CNID|nr:unnamed protein product [Porites lobata]